MVKTVIPVANDSKLQAQTGYSIKIDQTEIALFKVTSGEVFALENRSPHPKGGVLSEGLVSGKYVYCPVYDWKISLENGMVQAPDEGQVQTFTVEKEGDIIFLII
ncbi:nitrite reductase small subunit NirD [Robertmurraya andreesenii]|uniref:Nitrite reductase (NADH) small subunit n=1 Tax=Anoxybacillus andreesenii TaxID=1325932 RepID=A0ABT9V6S3_9BACL|nr:nitrite reductase small subunit NirD [Robertmurraya andreesenii]MDQ0156540.1 nitrite reductase (NADH) small subunit [Robertmurraya andreesenii]